MGRKDREKLLWDDFNDELEIPEEEPIFPLSSILRLLDIDYYHLHEIIKEGLVKPKKIGKRKKLFSKRDIKCIKYIHYLMEEEGVNIKGVKIILKMQKGYKI